MLKHVYLNCWPGKERLRTKTVKHFLFKTGFSFVITEILVIFCRFIIHAHAFFPYNSKKIVTT